MKYSFRYSDRLYAGVVAEKDAGEPFGALHNRYGYDYYSFYLLLKNCGRLKALAVGNYRLSFGQGLVISTDYLMGKTIYASSFNSRSSGIKKHSSTQPISENGNNWDVDSCSSIDRWAKDILPFRSVIFVMFNSY